MVETTCCCQLKEQMIAQIQSMRKQHPDKSTEWAEWLFLSPEESENKSLCCLLTYLFYYGYCKESTTSLSEEARSVLSPFLIGCKAT